MSVGWAHHFPGYAVTDRATAFRVRLLRHGLSIADFAARLGVSRQAVYNTLKGKPSRFINRAIDRFIAKGTV